MSFSEVVDHLRHDGVLEALAVSVVVWFLIVQAIRWVLLRIFDRPRAAEIFRVLGGPVVIAFLAAWFVQNALERIDDLTGLGTAGDFALMVAIVVLRLTGGVLVFLVLAGLFRVFHSEFLERQLRSHSRMREKNTATLLYGLVRPFGAVLAIAFVLSQFHLNLAGYLVTLGGASVALAVALQRLLANMFAGLSLAVDAPFGQNDLIRTSDDRLYEVVERGLRMTTMRDITTHDTVHFPNSVLAESPFAEVTRPTDDVRVVIDVGVPYDANLRDVRKTLLDIALGHPHVVGPFKKKEQAIQKKVARLFLRHELEECMQHWIELARLKAENELNEAISELRWELEAQATQVDELESHGFDRDEKYQLAVFAARLREKCSEIEELTTVWVLAVRNGVARGRFLQGPQLENDPLADPLQRPKPAGDYLMGGLSPTESKLAELLYSDATKDNPLKAPGELETISDPLLRRKGNVEDNQERMAALDRALGRMSENIDGKPGEAKDRLEFELRTLFAELRTELETDARFHLYALRIANELAAWVRVEPESPELWASYNKQTTTPPYKVDTADAWKSVVDSYATLGMNAVGHILDGTKVAVADEGISVTACRSRSEDLFHSERMIRGMLDHDWCSKTLGVVYDDDERSDLAELFRMWGDKTAELVEQLDTVARHLEAARSTTIDSELRRLASNLRMTFKDPFPLWKAPIASVEGYDESSIHLAMKVYVDNVRMDKYMRMFATLTNLRMRVVERLANDGITLPYPRREVQLLGRDGRAVDPHGNGEGVWQTSDGAEAEPAGSSAT